MAGDDDSPISWTIDAFKFASSNSKQHTCALICILWLTRGGALRIFSSMCSISHLIVGEWSKSASSSSCFRLQVSMSLVSPFQWIFCACSTIAMNSSTFTLLSTRVSPLIEARQILHWMIVEFILLKNASMEFILLMFASPLLTMLLFSSATLFFSDSTYWIAASLRTRRNFALPMDVVLYLLASLKMWLLYQPG